MFIHLKEKHHPGLAVQGFLLLADCHASLNYTKLTGLGIPFFTGGLSDFLFVACPLFRSATEGQLLAELSATGNARVDYIYLNGQVLAQRNLSSGKTSYVHADHLGTPRSMSDAAGRRVWTADYDPFGQATVNEDPDGDGKTSTLNLRFPGQYFDLETGLHYNYFRDYDPALGRYVQSDPIGLNGGINTYAYTNLNPISNVDPLGLASCTFVMSIGRLVCTPSNPQNSPVNIPAASGNNGGGQQCRNNPACTAIPNRGPIPTGCWQWTNGTTGKPNGRVLVPCPGTNTNATENRTLIRSHSCANPFGPGLGPQYCSEGCVTGTAPDIQNLNGLIDAEPGSTLQVVP